MSHIYINMPTIEPLNLQMMQLAKPKTVKTVKKVVFADVKEEVKEDVFPITIVTSSGEKSVFNFSRDQTIADISAKIESTLMYARDQQRLIHAGRQLEMGRQLKDYNINGSATIHLILRLRGGMFHSSSGRNDFGIN